MTKTGSTAISKYTEYRPISVLDSDKKIFDAGDTTVGAMVMDAFATEH
jgi:hypothetical protein